MTGLASIVGSGSGRTLYAGVMLRRLDLRAAPLPRSAALRGLLPRAELDVEHATATVAPIVADVRTRGAAALRAIEAARA